MVKPNPQPPVDELRELYEVRRMTTRAIGAHYGVSKPCVVRWLRKMGIPIRAAGHGRKNKGIPEVSKEELYRLMHVEHLTYEAIGARYGCSKEAAYKWALELGVGKSSRYAAKSQDVLAQLPDADALRALYEAGNSTIVIAARFGLTHDSVRRALIHYGIPRRAGGFKGCPRQTCKDGHVVRSTYEQRVDDWLTEHGIEHVYEPALPMDSRYHADFLANGWYIEVWGVFGSQTYKARKQRKLAMYRAHGLPLIQLHPNSFHSRAHGYWQRLLAKRLIQTPAEQWLQHPL